jgi:hypothetical protein
MRRNNVRIYRPTRSADSIVSKCIILMPEAITFSTERDFMLARIERARYNMNLALSLHHELIVRLRARQLPRPDLTASRLLR